jgi:hypothetical protein
MEDNTETPTVNDVPSTDTSTGGTDNSPSTKQVPSQGQPAVNAEINRLMRAQRLKDVEISGMREKYNTLEKDVVDLRKLKDQLSDPTQVHKLFNMTEKQFAEAFMSKNRDLVLSEETEGEPVDPTLARIAALEKQIADQEASKKKAEDDAREKHQQETTKKADAKRHGDALAYISANKDKYELLHDMGSEGASLYNESVQTFFAQNTSDVVSANALAESFGDGDRKKGYIMIVDLVAAATEEVLEAQRKELIARTQKLKKFAPPPPVVEQKVTKKKHLDLQSLVKQPAQQDAKKEVTWNDSVKNIVAAMAKDAKK